MKALKLLGTCLFCLIVLLGISSFTSAAPLPQSPGTILYVKPGANGTCALWSDACELQTALSKAVSGDQIWVAAGTYKPTTTSDRTKTFQLKSGVAIYGGFAGTETSLTSRNWVTNLTILSGDIGSSDNSGDNSYHVVTGSGVGATAVLDGFTITAGNANGFEFRDWIGGGMVNNNSSPSLMNVIFSGNTAGSGGGMYNENYSSPNLTNVTFSGNTAYYGGGMYNSYDSSPNLTNVTFIGNTAGAGCGGMFNDNRSNPSLTNVTFSGNTAIYGGGMVNNNSSPSLMNVIFSGNTAGAGGGGMYNYVNSNPTLTNVTFSGNTTTSEGGGMYNYYNSSPSLTNVTFSGNSATSEGGGIVNRDTSSSTLNNAILWGNTPNQQIVGTAIVTYSDIQNWTSGGTGNMSSDPLLGALADNGGFTQTYALSVGSKAIDAGDPGNCPSTDQRGFHRPVDGDHNGIDRCDMGAFELGYSLTVNIEGSGSVNITPQKIEYQPGDIVTLTATADPGWTFINWTGATVADNKVTITGNTTVTANFTPVIFKISLPLVLR